MVYPDTIRPTVVEMLINGTWTDITRYVLQRQAVTVNRGAGGEDNSMPPTTAGLLLRNDDGRFAQDNPMSPYWPYLKQACQIRYKITHGGVTYTRFWLETADAPMVVEPAPENNTVTLECGGLFRRWERSKALESPLRRTISAASNLVAYWPMEDEGERAQTLASAIPGQKAMSIKAAVDVAGYSGFSASKPVPNIGDGQVTGLVKRYSPVGNQTAMWLAKGPVANVDTTIMTLLVTGGTLYRIAVLASTNGDLRIRFYDRDGNILSTSSYVGTHNINDRDMSLRLMVANSGANVNWFLASIDQLDVSTTVSTSGSVLSEQIGSISSITFGYFNNYGQPAGHAAIFNGTPSNLNAIAEAFGAYRGETAGERFRRICRDNNVSHRMIGDADTKMGPQPIGSVKDILQDAANAEHGLVFESRDDFGLTMLARSAMYNQGSDIRIAPDFPVTATGTSSTFIVSSDYDAWFWAGVEFQLRVASTDALVTSTVFTVTDKYTSGSNIVVTFTPTSGTTPTTTHIITIVRTGLLSLDYTQKEVAFPFKPVKDDRMIANRVTVSRREGTSATVSQDVGPRSTQDPPEGVGLYEVTETLGLYSDGQCAEHASWLLGQGTNEDPRFPDLQINLHRRSLASRQADLLSADLGHLITIDNARGAYMFDKIKQIGRGYTEVFDGNKFHTHTWNTVPAHPYDILEFDSTRLDCRWGANSTVLAQSLTTTQTGAVSVSVGQDEWSTTGSDFPQPVNIGGEVVTLSGISGGAGSIAFVGLGTPSQADAAGSVAAGLPAGAVSGNIVLLFAAIRDDAATVNTPTNWTLVAGAGTNMRLFARSYNGVWTMPTVTFSGGGAGDTTIALSAAFSGITISSAITNTAASGTGDDIRVYTNNMGAVAGQYGLRLALGIKFDDWTTIVPPTGLDELESFPSTLGNDLGSSWAYAIDSTSGNYAGGTGSFTTSGGAAAFWESFVVFFPSAPQTFTISARSVNGVVKTHSVGAQVDVASPFYYGL